MIGSEAPRGQAVLLVHRTGNFTRTRETRYRCQTLGAQEPLNQFHGPTVGAQLEQKLRRLEDHLLLLERCHRMMARSFAHLEVCGLGPRYELTTRPTAGAALLRSAPCPRRAGYAPNSARQEAHRMLTNAYIEAAISELIRARSERTRITADRVVEELAALGFANIIDFMRIGDDGCMAWRGPSSRPGAPTTMFSCTASTGDRSMRGLDWPAMPCICSDLTPMWRLPTILERRALSIAIAPSVGSRSAFRRLAEQCTEPICRSTLSLPATWMPLLAFDRCMGVRLLAQVAFKNAMQ